MEFEDYAAEVTRYLAAVEKQNRIGGRVKRYLFILIPLTVLNMALWVTIGIFDLTERCPAVAG